MVFNSLSWAINEPVPSGAHTGSLRHFKKHLAVRLYVSLLTPSALMDTETKGNNNSSHNHMLLSVPAVVDNGAEKSSSLIKWIH